MNTMKLFTAGLLLFAEASAFLDRLPHLKDSHDSLKVGFLTDVHLHLRYDEYKGADGGQYGGQCFRDDASTDVLPAPMGRYGCDPPQILLETMFQNFKDTFGEMDVIVVTGDFNGHSVAADPNDPDWKQTYSLLLDTYAGLNQLFVEYFPNTIVLPAFGNNDNEYHDNPTLDAEAEFFYDFVYRMWF